MSCQSPGPGKGSTFTICLPSLGRVTAPAWPDGVPQQPADVARALRLLVVDDNVDAAEVLSMLLQASGRVVTVAHDPRRALELARVERPDVCLLDIGLPGMDGNELAQRLPAQPGTAGAVLIAVTGYGQAEDRQRSRESKFDHHLVKPLDHATLKAILERLHAGPGRENAAFSTPPAHLSRLNSIAVCVGSTR